MSLHLPDDGLAERIREHVLDMLHRRGMGRSICPSEAARAVAGELACDWQDLMRPVRTVAAAMVDSGLIEATQHEAVVDLRDVRGPIRLRLRSLAGRRNGTIG